MTKVCTKCGTEKPLDQFHKHAGCKHGRNSVCKVCHYVANTHYRETHRERFREYARRRPVEKMAASRRKYEAAHPEKIVARRIKKYGLTLEEYDAMFEAQGGVCLICGKAQANGWRLDVDHDHKTGGVRGLLCRRCNQILGMAEDDKARLLEAALYLERHGK